MNDDFFTPKEDLLLADCKALERVYDGSDNKPVFNTKEILDYMEESGISSPEYAFMDLYNDEFINYFSKLLVVLTEVNND